MLRFTLRRIAYTLPALLGVITLSFLLIRLIPGDPVDSMLGDQAAEADKVVLRHQLGLDQPLGSQYMQYLLHLSRWNLGTSLHSHEAVTSSLALALPATFQLAFAALLLAALWGIPLGVWSAVRRGSPVDTFVGGLSLLGMSVPAVFLGPLLIYVFAIRLGWFPVSEAGGIESLVLPALSLAFPLGAALTRMTRVAVIEAVAQDYIRTAHAKGLGRAQVYFKHALANALIPVLTIFGLQLGAVLTGTVVTETIFDWPGLGSLLYASIQRRDYPAVQACVLVVALIYVLVNLLTDLAYGSADPRIRRMTEDKS